MSEPSDRKPGRKDHITRRELLRRGAIAGAVAWAAPVIRSLPAHAHTVGSPTFCCCECRQSGGQMQKTGCHTEFDSPPKGPINAQTCQPGGLCSSNETATLHCGPSQFQPCASGDKDCISPDHPNQP